MAKTATAILTIRTRDLLGRGVGRGFRRLFLL